MNDPHPPLDLDAHVIAVLSSELRLRSETATLSCSSEAYMRWQAVCSVMRRAVHAGAIPIINQMAGAGIITLPGIMSGQIPVGQDPMAAAQSQIFLMFLLCAASVASIIITAFLSLSRLTDERHCLRLDRLTKG